ncbi:MAG: IclR family transcriptional regulator [Chloroflexota bacterium]
MPSPAPDPTDEPGAVADPGSVYDVAVLQKALDLLEMITEAGDLGLAELSSRTGASKASAFRVLSTLHRRGYVSKDPVTRRYTPGPRLIALSFANVSKLQLAPRARPVLEELREEFGETVNLGILADHDVLYLEIAESVRSLRMSSEIGARDRLHSTSLGKAILAALPVAEARTLLEAYERKPATRRTIIDLDALMAELRQTKERGYSIDDEENEVGARCVGVAVTDVSGRPQAAISMSGPAARVFDSTIDAIGARLIEAAEEVATLMGWRPVEPRRPERATRGSAAGS